MVQYRIQMFEVAVEEGSGPDKSPLNLADLRLQLGRYRSRWDSFDQATRETITIPPTKIRICEKGYLAYVLQGDSGATFCARVIRLPSICNGVTRGEWTFNLEMLSPDAMVLGMTLQPELDLLVVIVSSCGHTYVLVFILGAVGLTLLDSRVSRVHTLQLSNGRPHSTIPTPEPIRSEAGFRFLTLQPCITRYRLAFLVIYLQPGSQNACTFRVYELQTGQVILVQFIRPPQPLISQADRCARTNLNRFYKSNSSMTSGCWARMVTQLTVSLCGTSQTQPPKRRGPSRTPHPPTLEYWIGSTLK